MIYVFLGKDFNILKRKISELIDSLNINNIIKYDFNDSSITEIIEEVNYVDLFNDKKLILVSDFSFKKLKKEDEELLSKYIDNMNDNVIIFKCIDEFLDERKSLVKLLKSKCKVEECKKLDYKDLHEYVTNLLKDSGIDTNYNQVKKIIDLCEYNVDYTINEVQKLLLYKLGDKTLTDDDIEMVISKNNEKEMFTLIENIMKKDIANSIKSFRILSSNLEVVVILDSIAKQFRLLFQIKDLKSQMDELTLSRNLGVNPYVIKKLYPYINSYTYEQLADILYRLGEIDIKIKVDGYDKYKAFESFLINL